jgi:hypothetical protein
MVSSTLEFHKYVYLLAQVFRAYEKLVDVRKAPLPFILLLMLKLFLVAYFTP